jgi:thiamine biosynthesis lipoprotein
LPASIISRINNNEINVLPDDHFIKVYNKSVEVSERTEGVFDFTVAPVINAWGFGFSKKEKVDSGMIKFLLQYIGFRKVSLQNNRIVKDHPAVMLDFNAIAQGYTVDVVAAYLNSKGIEDYFVELGGEVIAKGDKGDHEFWKIGIDKPKEAPVEEREVQAIIKLFNQALATSGNYRRYYEEEGQKYSHIIDPNTGYPAKNNLLSASVIANDCMTADAYATVFMVMGLQRSLQFLSDNRELNLGVYFIYDDKGILKTYTSESLNKWVDNLY